MVGILLAVKSTALLGKFSTYLEGRSFGVYFASSDEYSRFITEPVGRLSA